MPCHFSELDSNIALERDSSRKREKLTGRVTEISCFMHEEQEPNECPFEACPRTHENENVDDVFILKLPKSFGGMKFGSSSILERPVSQKLGTGQENRCDILESRNDFETDTMPSDVFKNNNNTPWITLKPRPQPFNLERDL